MLKTLNYFETKQRH